MLVERGRLTWCDAHVVRRAVHATPHQRLPRGVFVVVMVATMWSRHFHLHVDVESSCVSFPPCGRNKQITSQRCQCRTETREQGSNFAIPEAGIRRHKTEFHRAEQCP